MKKRILSLATVLFIGGAVVLTSCGKDEEAPIVTLKGDAEMTIALGSTFSDPGVTADDNEDGDVSSSVTATGEVNTNEVGVYTVSYSVTDAAGNASTPVTREVTVSAEALKGTYAVSDVVTGATPSSNNGTYSYSATVAAGNSYDEITITNFGGFGTSVIVKATVAGKTITIASQTPAGFDSAISGSGEYDGAAKKITKITYSCTAAQYGNGSATYTK